MSKFKLNQIVTIRNASNSGIPVIYEGSKGVVVKIRENGIYIIEVNRLGKDLINCDSRTTCWESFEEGLSDAMNRNGANS